MKIHNRRQFLKLFAGSCALALGAKSIAHEHLYYFGIVPYLPPRKIIKLYSPIVNWVSGTLDKKVIPQSAKDYKTHFERTSKGKYHFLATSPYFGRVAHYQYGFECLARPITNLEPLIITKNDSNIQTIEDCLGKKVAASDPWANITLAARILFKSLGWKIDKDVYLVPSGSHANSWEWLQAGIADAAVVSVT